MIKPCLTWGLDWAGADDHGIHSKYLLSEYSAYQAET